MQIMLSLAAVPLKQAKSYVRNFVRNGVAAQTIKKFQPKDAKHHSGKAGRLANPYRLYLPIDAKSSAPKVVRIPEEIEEAVAKAGYRIEDYVTGIATSADGKQKIRIGKLIKDDPELADIFKKDPARNVYKNEAVAVISCHPYDVAGMSTGRHWTSCMNLNGGMFSEYVIQDVLGSTLVAYAISPNDLNIEKPKARFLIKLATHPDDPSKTIYVLESDHYGTSVPGFKATLDKWLRIVNAGMGHGHYRVNPDLYDDGMGSEVLHIDAVDQIPEGKRMEALENIRGAVSYAKNILNVDHAWLPYLFKLLIKQDDSSPATYRSMLNQAISLGVDIPVVGKMIDDEPTATPEVVRRIFLSYVRTNRLPPGVEVREILTSAKKFAPLVEETFGYDSNTDVLLHMDEATAYSQFDPRWTNRIDFSKMDHRDRGHFIGRVLEQDIHLPNPFEPVTPDGKEVKLALEWSAGMFVHGFAKPTFMFTDGLKKLNAMGMVTAKADLGPGTVDWDLLEANGAINILQDTMPNRLLYAGYQAMIEADLKWAIPLCIFFEKFASAFIGDKMDQLLTLQPKGPKENDDSVAYNIVRSASQWTRMAKRKYKDGIDAALKQAKKGANEVMLEYIKNQSAILKRDTKGAPAEVVEEKPKEREYKVRIRD